jgi:7-cyano-7-deazaguanine synthase
MHRWLWSSVEKFANLLDSNQKIYAANINLMQELLLSEKGPVVCIVSGGLDSVCTAAHLAKDRKYEIYAITFVYGQRAMGNEVTQSKRFAKILNVQQHQVVNIGFMKQLYGETNSLTSTRLRLANKFDYSIVVPIRNAIFITIAAAWAMSMHARMIAYGAHADDINYPDCRPVFIKSMTNVVNLSEADAIRLGLRKKITIWSPVLDGITKTNLLKIGYRILGDEIFKTWSCYSRGVIGTNGDMLHCGICESCINRKISIKKAGIKDKTDYANNRD